jgi:putative PIN family toxin of toxin-antitoxin system
MRIVFDINILASAAVSPEGLPAHIVDTVIGGPHEFAMSSDMIAKLEEVMARTYFSSRLGEAVRAKTVDRYRRAALPFEPDPSVIGVADDDEDDKVIGTAVAANADIIVTGDKGLLTLKAFQGIPIVSAREFLVIVQD